MNKEILFKKHLRSQLDTLRSEFFNIKNKKDYLEIDALNNIKDILDKEISFYELKILLVNKILEEISKYDCVIVEKSDEEEIQIPLFHSKYFILEIKEDCKISFKLRCNISYINRFINGLVWNSLLEFELALGCSKKENKNLLFRRPIDELFILMNKDHYGLDKKSLYDCAEVIRNGVKDLVNILFSNESWQKNIIPILDKYFETIKDVTKGE